MDKEGSSDNGLAQKSPLASGRLFTRYELAWVMALTGTGLGAGVLFLPFAIGTAGLLPVIVLTLFSVPLVVFSHRNLSRICLSPETPDPDIHSVISRVFPGYISSALIVVTLLAVIPTLLVYSIGITNITSSLIEHQLHLAVPSKPVIALVLLLVLVSVLTGGEKWLLRASSGMVTPLTIVMLCLACALIPHWQMEFVFYQPTIAEFFRVILIGLPVMVFSFYHAPLCSVMARAYREREATLSRQVATTDRVHLASTLLLFVVILFFVVSCLLSLPMADIVAARHANLPVLSVLANNSSSSWFALVAPVIAFLAIATSFFGFFLGAVELINGILVSLIFRVTGRRLGPFQIHKVSIVLVTSGCLLAAIADWDVLDVIAGLVAPMMAIVVFFLPVAAMRRLPSLSYLRSPVQEGYILLGGALVVAGFLLSLL